LFKQQLVETSNMASTVFDPQELTIDASLNHVIIGKVGFADIAGMQAQDVCSRDAFHALAADLGLGGLRPDQLSDDLATAVASTDAATAQAAATALRTYGLRLGALIATLRDPATADQQADTPARHAFLAHWLTIDSIWLAGGLFAGMCGQVILEGVRAGAAAAARPCPVTLTPYPTLAPLLGAARHAYDTAADEVIAVADLGHTSIKTAVAEHSAMALRKLKLLNAHAAPPRRSRDDVEDAVSDALTTLVKRAAGAEHRRVRLVISVASFVTAGTPVDDGQGVYGCLANRSATLARRIAEDNGVDANLEFVHDGTAGASTASSPNSATITAGTWLGVGFQHSGGRPLLDLPPELQVLG
jgi:hypothetical protein